MVGRGVELTDAISFARDHKRGVLVTLRRDGHPQLSNILYHVDDGSFLISITATRAKYRNLVREPWAALHVARDDFFAYAVLEGTVVLSDVAASTDDATVEALVKHYRAAVGEHKNWDEFRQSMVDDQRVLVTLTPSRAYGMLP